ncbi:peroxisomal (S)-2-hydroxyacid oxidase GLO4-like [Solanum stenotomum]|uniref:peroxisomal (S)-2-hydroxyacid oxidase GLO4-like n=1 Tax=Solanum stenotomum TaxID=172797 RepID=UPI0020D15286|nr:peroxisomal (S)-2-hydroxyacid oxidase GLO4-like [Solanum stenotomum]
MSTVILGHKTSAPIMIAPTMMHKFAHPEGEIATARGAASCDVIAGLSFTCKVVRFIQTFVRYYSQLSLSSYVNTDFSCFAANRDL